MKRLLLSTALVAASAFAAHAADLLVQDSAAAPAAASSSFSGYVQVMGGMTLPNTLGWYDGSEYSYDMLSGWALGATFGIETPVDGVSLEADVLRTVVEYEDGGDFLNSTSVMGNAVFTAPLNDSLSLYAGAGAGFIMLDYNDDTDANDGTGSGLGYQIFGGAQLAVAENLSLTLEARHQATFEPVTLDSGDYEGDELDFNRTSILAGVLFSF